MKCSARIHIFCLLLVLSLLPRFSTQQSPKAKSTKSIPSQQDTTVTSHGQPYPPQEDNSQSIPRTAIQLSAKNFASHVGDGNVWLIEFYAPWCRHCQEFTHSYNNVAANFHSSPNEGIRVGKVDCQEEKALKTRFGIRSLPTFFIVDGWTVYEFEKVRSEANLMDFARGGYKKQDPLPLYASPMGPMGLFQGLMISLGAKIIEFFDTVQESYGLSPVLAGFVLSFVGVVAGMFSVILLAVLTTPKAKID